MLKYFKIFLITLICCFSVHAQKSFDPLTAKTVNWGLNAGFNALNFTHYNAYQGETKLNNTSYTGKVGFSGGMFLRINLSNFFMQPEVGYSLTRERFSFAKINDLGNSLQQTVVNADYHSLRLPVLAGYNIVKNSHYLFNCYLGPDFQYCYRSSFNLGGTPFKDKSPQFSINGTIGLSLSISHLFFDFRYGINRPNTDFNFGKVPDSPELLKDILVKKNENILSFSCGMIF
ncbi:MAG: PorT family protein [Dysgonamonadaceae bacterium]|jgi:hypothetical protein|nr:PorT family protein [Dysgonamonadaceae bacterium]